MPPSSFTINDLNQILIDNVGLSHDDALGDLDTPFAVLGIDSLALIAMKVALEEEYGLDVANEDLSTLTSPRATIEYANKRLMEGNP
jgi:act minimal PKS acyl carrier protein